MPKVAVGGTFQYLHDGHARLIEKAFEIAGSGKVYIGLTSDEMLQKTTASKAIKSEGHACLST